MGNCCPKVRKKAVSLKRLEPLVPWRSVTSRKISILDVSVPLPMPAVHDKTCRVCGNDAGLVFVLTVQRYTAIGPRGYRSWGVRYSLTDTSGRSIGRRKVSVQTGLQTEREKNVSYMNTRTWSEVIPAYVLRAMGRRLNVESTWMWVLSYAPRPFYPREENSGTHWIWDWLGPQGRSGVLETGIERKRELAAQSATWSKYRNVAGICACLDIYTYINTYIHTYMHTYIHTYIHTCVLVNKYLQQFSQFTNSIDFEKLQWMKTQDRAKEKLQWMKTQDRAKEKLQWM